MSISCNAAFIGKFDVINASINSSQYPCNKPDILNCDYSLSGDIPTEFTFRLYNNNQEATLCKLIGHDNKILSYTDGNCSVTGNTLTRFAKFVLTIQFSTDSKSFKNNLVNDNDKYIINFERLPPISQVSPSDLTSINIQFLRSKNNSPSNTNETL